MIPDSSDPKSTDTDLKIAQLINNYTLPKDKNELFDLLQWIYVQLQSNHTPFGDQTIESLEKIHQRTYEMLKVLPKDKNELFDLLQWIYVQLQSNHTPFGDQTIESLEKIHQRTYEMLKVLCKNDEEMTNLSKQYAPKKKFIFWKG